MNGPDHRLRRTILVVAAASLAVAVAPLSAASAASAAAAGTPGYQGTAYGTTITVAGAVTSDPTANTSFGCGTPAGYHDMNSTASVGVPNLLTTGTISTTGDTTANPNTTVTSSTVQSINALGGLVTASTVTAKATASGDPASGFSTSAQGTSFGNLKVLGLPILLSPKKNTKVGLPGVGYVILNQQKSTVTASTASLQVVAIHVVVTQLNLLGYDVGTNINVGVAASALTAPIGGALNGFAYGTQVAVGQILNSDPTFRVALPCGGTNGQVITKGGAGVNVPGILNSGTVTDTAQGASTATTADGTTTSTVQSVNLLNDLVSATGVRSVANASRSSGTTVVNATGSTFATVVVDGTPLVVADIAPNTRISLVGVGDLYLNRVILTATSVEVRQIEIDVLQANPLGIAVGTTIYVAVARTGVR